MFNIHTYVKSLNEIDGWCDQLTAKAIYFIGLTQEIPGNVLEIGIHHGKSFIPLAASIKEDEQAIAIDIFENQHLNIDDSGHGDKNAFEINLAKFLGKFDVQIIQEDSTKLASADIPGPIRLMSIDGGHTKEITYSDLKLADTIVDRYSGIVFLDDFLNEDWLGVLSGYLSYINDYDESFIPIAYFPNKIVLSRPLSAKIYKDKLFEHFKESLSKPNVPFMEHFIDVYK